MSDFLAALVGLIIGAVALNSITATEIAADCEKLGTFRVGAKVFICEVKK